MLGSNKYDVQTALSGPPEQTKHKRKKHTAIWLAIKLLIVSPLLWLVASYAFGPQSFDIEQGKLTCLIVGAPRSGGKVIYSLGPFGSFVYHTHKTPVNLNLDLELKESAIEGKTREQIVINVVEGFKADDWKKLQPFVLNRAFWFGCCGALLGLLVSTGGKHPIRRSLWFTAGGGLVALVLVFGFVGITKLTLNDKQEMTYTGIARIVPKLVDSIEQDAPNYQIPPGTYNNFYRGPDVVKRQAILLRQNANHSTNRVRFLVGGDFHSNLDVGLNLFNGILHDKIWEPFDGVLLAGDLTQWGFGFQARQFKGKVQTGKIPIRIVGGNHESADAMQVFQEIGMLSLNGQVLDIRGVKILGMDDPLAESYDYNSKLELLKQNSQQLANLWENMGSSKPQVILVHDVEQANDVVKLAQKEKLPLTVIFGHDHKTSVERKGTITYVGCGTGGASGTEGLGDNPGTLYTCQIVDFSTDGDHRLLSVITLTYDGETHTSTTTPHFFLN